MSSRGYDSVLPILTANTTSLRELANISGHSPFAFYQGADLSDLDLSGQDLSGLNFDRADLRFSNLNEIKFDAGAFNNSILDFEQEYLKDQYSFTLDDLKQHDNSKILIFCQIRPDLIDELISFTGFNFSQFSEFAEVGIHSLRKARNSAVIAQETALKILTALENVYLSATGIDSPVIGRNYYCLNKVNQPNIIFLSGGQNGVFNKIERLRMVQLWEMREAIAPLRRYDYRDTPESIELSYLYFGLTDDIS